jgi:hypothetical protein
MWRGAMTATEYEMPRFFHPLPVLLFAALASGCAEQAAPPPPAIDEAALAARSQPIAAEFQAALQSQLKAALAAGGPEQAVAVCQQVAPAIAAAQSERSGAEVRRIALRNRNPDGAVPDFLRAGYDQLAGQPLTDGAPSSAIVRSGEGEAAKIHYMSAIPMREQPCSTCHGTNIDPELKAKIDALYPGDAAVGFEPGDLRGALVISWPASAFAQ